ncbi:Multidrug resistance protein CDR1 [Candida viswanathii]|uniref:Multidrug resistance protein CDR1 n=1 Tax=Candida viswanathii TaxID=5486 RepID=A0A367YJB0_9ASCO|nr:Multidrug resistance protein CDR1 [Candida viswanathii]
MSDKDPNTSSASDLSNKEYTGFNKEEIKNLARTITADNSSQALVRYLSQMSQVPGVNPCDVDNLPAELNPDSDDFDSKLWIKNLRKLYDSDPEYWQHSKLGVAYRDLRVYGVANDVDYQPTVTNALWKLAGKGLRHLWKEDKSRYFDILKTMDGIMRPGEVTVVLGRPGAGCSTLLKTIAAQTYGFHVAKESVMTYDGMTQGDIEHHYRGDVIYSAETEVHIPHMTVGHTLEFAARLRTPLNRGIGISREAYAKHMADAYMATYGISHTRNTKVGNDIVRGVSGGERKRVSIAEVSLSGAKIQCWDNSTRGLDSATALEFVRALKISARILECTPVIAIYQCSQDSYDLFDNVIVLYEGYQIFFGKADRAKEYFINMGYKCLQRQTTADYLTSLTNPAEREPLPGYENRVPRTPQEFEAYWKSSPEYAALVQDIDGHLAECEKLNTKQVYHNSHVARQSKHIRPSSPYTVSFFMQVRYLVARNFIRMKGDPSIAILSSVGQLIMGLILASVFYNLPPTTSSFYYRGVALFYAVLFNAFSSMLEVMTLYEARPVVEKHRKFALYRPSADALASIVSELPVKLAASISFNFVFYFMVNLRREPGRFFFYWLMNIFATLVMSHFFRSVGAVTTSLEGAMTPSTILLLAMVIYTGFVVPKPDMLGWAKWISYINPVAYVFESIMVNEFHGRDFLCSTYVPTGPFYENVSPENQVCTAVGSVPGEAYVSGTEFLRYSYQYYNAHKWRNLGIVIGFTIFFLAIYIGLTEINRGAMQKGEIVLFLKGDIKKQKRDRHHEDVEGGGEISEKVTQDALSEEDDESRLKGIDLAKEREIFFWKDLTYKIRIKKEDRVILDHVDGWVKPGQITALMGATGAGKTTLLNCLSGRLAVGVVTDGERLVNGHRLDSSFPRSIGYVQQQDIHLQTSTVREALRFSAYLRQSRKVSKKEKDEYVEYILNLLDMTSYADALVGVAGEGLNVEQRKRLTIGVELVAKPKLLLFLDEPTSGLDSQTAWSICKLMRKLADHGQAILCTIHQPSALIMAEFDRLLFLQKGGETVYFGDLGENCQTMIDYFEKHGAHPCPKEANPAEWMLEVVGAAPGSHAKQNYFEVWRNSDEYQAVRNEISRMETELIKLPRDEDPESRLTYAAPLWKQYFLVTWRTIVQDWRTPGYIYGKLFLVITSSLFNGFSFFNTGNSIQTMTNQMFSIFMSFIVLNSLLQQMLPAYVKNRDLFETREAPSRTFSWFTFISSQISSEIPFQLALGTIAYFSWYYPVGLYRNAEPTDSVHSRGAFMWLLQISFYVYITTLGHFANSFTELPDAAANLANLMFSLCLIFCGVLAGPDQLPGFWIFMYRCNPLTYLIQAILSTALANSRVQCSPHEYVQINPPSNQTCEDFMGPFAAMVGGYVVTEQDTCLYCPMDETNTFLKSVNAIFSERYRNYGIFVAFIMVNIIFAIFFYWLARVPKGNRESKQVKRKIRKRSV